MSHNLLENDQMFSVKETPWHRLGHVIEKAPTIEEAIQLANLDWEVNLMDLSITNTGTPVTHKASVRSDTGEVLGVVGPNWTPLQNRESFSFFDEFIESGSASLETAGSLRNGRIVWVLAKINIDQQEVIKGDPIERYVLLSNEHSGKMAVRVGFTDVRVVCNNTLNIAHNSEASKLIRVKHSRNVSQNVMNIKEVMNLAEQEFIANVEQMKMLTRKGINSEDVANYVKMTFFQGVDLKSTRATNRFETTLDKINELIEVGQGSDLKGVKGTVWGLYNASTEYLTHYIGKDDEKRLESLWFGQNVKLNSLLLDKAVELVA